MKVARHHFEGTLADLRAAMDKAATEDDEAERQIQSGCNRSCLGVLLLVAAGGGGYVAGGAFGATIAWGAATPVALIGLWVLIASFNVVGEATPHDLDDVKVDTVRRVLKFLAADTTPTARMKLDVDFREASQGEFVDPTASQGKQVWRQPWLVLGGRFADGTSWRMTVERRMSRVRKPKTRGREKVTERFRDRLVLDVKVNPQRYGDLTALPQRTPPPPPPLQVLQGTAQGTQARAVLATPEATTLTVRGTTTKTGHELLAGPESIVSALVWVYQGLSTLRVERSLPPA